MNPFLLCYTTHCPATADEYRQRYIRLRKSPTSAPLPSPFVITVPEKKIFPQVSRRNFKVILSTDAAIGSKHSRRGFGSLKSPIYQAIPATNLQLSHLMCFFLAISHWERRRRYAMRHWAT